MQEKEIEKFGRIEKIEMPPDFNYDEIKSLSLEVREKLSNIRPLSLGQASRIPGVTPAAISILMVYLKRRKSAHAKPSATDWRRPETERKS